MASTTQGFPYENPVIETYKTYEMIIAEGEGPQAGRNFYLEPRGWGWRYKSVLHEGRTALGKRTLILRGDSSLPSADVSVKTGDEKMLASFVPKRGSLFGRSTTRMLWYNGSTYYWKLFRSSWKKDHYQLTDTSGNVLAVLTSKNWFRTDGILLIMSAGAALPRELIIATGLAAQKCEHQRKARSSGAVSSAGGGGGGC